MEEQHHFEATFPFPLAKTHTELLTASPSGAGARLHLWRIDTSVLRGSTVHSAPAYGSFGFFFLRERILVLSHLVKQYSMWFPGSLGSVRLFRLGPEPEKIGLDLPPNPPLSPSLLPSTCPFFLLSGGQH